MSVRSLLAVALLLAALLLAGCSDSGDLIKSYARPADVDDDEFMFSVEEGVKRLEIHFSTEGLPSSPGQAELEVFGGSYFYEVRLGHGESDTQVVSDPVPGQYFADLDYDGYTGPASVEVRSLAGAAIPGGSGGSLLAGQFWEILGIVLTLGVAAGGWFLYRHHTKRLDRAIKRIDETFRKLRSDTVDCRKRLLQLETEFQQKLVSNKLKESHFMILEKRIERYLQELKERMKSGTGTEAPLEWE